MKTVDSVEKKKLHQLVDNLPLERLDQAKKLLEQLLYEARIEVQQGNRVLRLGGLWENTGIELTEDDIVLTRREVWGRISEVNE